MTRVVLERFIRTFQKAIGAEMEAMRRRLGPFEAPLAQMRRLEAAEGEAGRTYAFRMVQPNDKVAAHVECTLKYDGGQALVTVVEVAGGEVVLRSDHAIGLDSGNYTLVIYPWFLYERLQAALETLLKEDTFFVDNALLLFGVGEPRRHPHPVQGDLTGLNESQRRAVQLCLDSSLAFVWGPPGTGKTRTLGYIVAELLAQGQRLLVTSTTHAAVDQALGQLAQMAAVRPWFERGQIVRIGQTAGETYGAGLREVVERLHAELRARLDRLAFREQSAAAGIRQCDALLDRLDGQLRQSQRDLFGQAEAPGVAWTELTRLFPHSLAEKLLTSPAARQAEAVARRRQRLARVVELSRPRAAELRQALRRQQAHVVGRARMVLATMTNVYLSSLLADERFDTVVVEEAGMAVLPTLFYCAALARRRIVVVGDPQQLPPIVQSRDEYVYRAMGRTIFEVADGKSLTARTMVMLDTQYRMHPRIGELVSRLFYQGRLQHSGETWQREEIARRAPYPRAALVVIDTAGRTACYPEPGGLSRINETTARRCVELSLEAVRAGTSSVAIITPYAAQSRFVRKQLSRFRQEAAGVECRTVHRFQGGERDVVILDTVDTAPMPPGVLLTGSAPSSSARNLLNVSLSRARGKVIILADVAYFARTAPGSAINELLGEAIRSGVRASIEVTDSRI